MDKWIILKGLALLGYVLFEKWLGGTKKVKANSTVDLVLNPAMGILKSKLTFFMDVPRKGTLMQTQNIKELISLIASGVKAGMQIAADGKVSLDDMPLLLQVIQKVPAAVADIGQVPAEFADLDEAEALELVAYAMTELSLPEDKAKKIVEHSLKVVIEVYGLVLAIKG